jgi:glycosyltransferase involved in cell wall biosynthesis
MDAMRHPLSIAFVVRDPLPPARADLLTLFGAELPRHGIGSALIGQRGGAAACAWGGGAMHAAGSFGGLLAPCWDALGLWRAWRAGPVDCVQVRDKIGGGVVGRVAAAMLGVPFIYWMSFPIVEGYAVRRDEIGRAGRGVKWAAHALRARLSRIVFYRLVLPGARHLFVQSDAMAGWLAGRGFERARMTAVPMGVDPALFERAALTPASDPRLDGRRVIVYLGRIAQSRQSGFLLDVVELLRADLPAVLLVVAGDAPSPDQMDWMRKLVAARGLHEHVLLTGWLPRRAALGYALRAEVGLSPIPRGALFDVSSPTKLVEYLALGIAAVANDIPDQQLVIAQSGAGLSAPMQAAPFSAAVRALLDDPVLRAQCAARGPAWVRCHRSYAILGRQVAQAYRAILPARLADPCAPARVLMIGTALGGKGGVASVVDELRRAGLFELESVRYLDSHVDGTRRAKLAAALRALWRTVLACVRERPAVVHVHSASHASFARKSLLLLIARAAGCRTIFHLHGGGFDRFAAVESGPALRWWIRHTLEHSSAVVALSAGWADFVRRFAPAARVEVIPNAVAVPSAVDRALEQPGRILFLGRAEAGKGVFDLLAAVAALAPAFPMIELVIGAGGDHQQLRRRAAELGIADRVLLPGWLDGAAKAREIARAQVFCLPSHAEGLPMAMLEAMAAARAVVASAVGAIPEAIVDRANGLLVAPRDVPALSAALSALLADGALRERLGDAARATVQRRFGIEPALGKLSALYRELAR